MKKRLLMIIVVMALAVQGVACSADSDERETGEKIEETVQPEVSQDVKTKEPEKSAVPGETPSKTSGPTIAPTLEPTQEPEKTPIPTATFAPVTDNSIDLDSINSVEELEKIIEEDVDNTIAVLSSEFNTLKGDNDSYSKFKSNVKDVEAFYDKIVEQTEKLCIRLQEYAVKYGEIIMNSNTSASDKYDDFDDMYDCIYDDACDEILDGVYNGILDDMLDSFYNGIIDDYDYDNYSEWSDILSKEYRRWSDASSDVYKLWSDTSSEVYGFWSDMQSELWNDDLEGANEDLMDYKEDVQKLSK